MHKVEDGRDNPEIVTKNHDIAASTVDRQSESTNSECTKSEAMPSEADTIQSNIESKIERLGIHSEVDKCQTLGSPSHYDIPIQGTLYYKPPQLDSYVQLDSNLANNSSMQSELDIFPAMPPKTFLSPPSVKGGSLSAQTPESILKIAAKSFPNTPSILRKRKSETRHSQAILPNGNHNHMNISEKVELQNHSLCADHVCDDDVGLSNSRSFDASPPYRLAFKRNSVLRSVGKQLNFASNMEQDYCENGTKSGNSVVRRIPPVTKFYTRQRRG